MCFKLNIKEKLHINDNKVFFSRIINIHIQTQLYFVWEYKIIFERNKITSTKAKTIEAFSLIYLIFFTIFSVIFQSLNLCFVFVYFLHLMHFIMITFHQP